MQDNLTIQTFLDKLQGRQLSEKENLLRQRDILDTLIDCSSKSINAKLENALKISTPLEDVYISPLDVLVDNGNSKIGVIFLRNDNITNDLDLLEIKQILSHCLPKISHLNVSSFKVINNISKNVLTFDITIDDIIEEKPYNFINFVASDKEDSANLDIESMACQLAALRLISQEADLSSKKLEVQISKNINIDNFEKSDQVSFGIARTKINKIYDVDKVDDKVIMLMESLNFSEDDVESLYKKHPNFWIPGKIDLDTLLNLIEFHLKVDVRTDERFLEALIDDGKPNISNRVEFLKDLDSSNLLDLDDLVDWDLSTIKTELIREALSGPTRELRNEVVASIRETMDILSSTSATYYSVARQEVIKKQELIKNSKKKAGSANKKAKKSI